MTDSCQKQKQINNSIQSQYQLRFYILASKGSNLKETRNRCEMSILMCEVMSKMDGTEQGLEIRDGITVIPDSTLGICTEHGTPDYALRPPECALAQR